MARQLIPLNPIRAFEAAGRHLSLSRAADELNVTQSAVSRQVKLLEEILGVGLFDRTQRSISLSVHGKKYLDDIADAFAILEDATSRVRENRSADILKLRVFSTFALRWLIPRLGSFVSAFPEIEVRIMNLSPSHPVDFEHEFADAHIRTGFGDWPGVRSDRLISNNIVPVCRKDLAGRLRSVDDLRNVTLLHSYARRDDWRKWLSFMKVEGVDPVQGMKFENSSLAYEAAVGGLGIVVAQISLVEKELRSGDLVIPFPSILPADKTYYLISLMQPIPTRVKVFREWILKQCAAEIDGALASVPIP